MDEKGYLLQLQICSAYIKADSVSIKQIILIKNDTSLKKRLKKESCSHDEFPIKGLLNRLTSYFNGEPVDFGYECDISHHTELGKNIIDVVKGIPYGKTMTYEQVAEIIGNKNLRRAVGSTVGKNRCPIVIPCHRVVGKGGKLTGFSADGGIKLKEELLKLEGAI